MPTSEHLHQFNIIVLNCNVLMFLPFSPPCPEKMDWSDLYPNHFAPLSVATITGTATTHGTISTILNCTPAVVSVTPSTLPVVIQSHSQVEFADVGCGYGGLLGNKSISIFFN